MRAPIPMTANRSTTRWRLSPAPACCWRIGGRNAFSHGLAFDNFAALELLPQYGADPNEPQVNSPHTEWGSPLLWAIKRRRSRLHVAALVKAGADPTASTR